MALIGLTLALDGSALAQRQRQSSSGPGRGPGEYYAPYRGNPEDEPRKKAEETPAEEINDREDRLDSPPEYWDQGDPDASGGPDDNWPDLEPADVSGPSGRVSERSQMLFPDDPNDPDYDKIPPADLPRPEEYPDLTVVPLPPTASSPPPTAPRAPTDQQDPVATGQDRVSGEDPAGAVPALSIYPETTRSALPKGAVPGLVTNPRDVALLEKLRRNNDPAGNLGWETGAEVSGPGLQGDAEGRLSGLNLENLDLSGVLDLAGAEALLEFKSVGNPLTGLRMTGLSRLSSLTLTGGSLGRLGRGALTGLTNLISLDLSRSGIEKIEANALAGLKSLENLRLNDNRLEQLGQGCFNGLNSVAELDLNNNQLSEVRWGALAPLTGLVTLHLAGNHLREIHGGFFPGLTNLEILHLENNRLVNVTREALADLSALKYMDLSNNYLKSLPTLGYFENLSEVDLTANCLTLGAMKEILSAVPNNAAIHLKGQANVYFGLRVQQLPGQDHYLIPPEDAFIDDIPSYGRVLGPDPSGASYTPPETAGQPGRLTFHRPGRYALLLTNSGLGDTPDLSTTTGVFVVVDSCPTEAEAVKLLGSRELAAGLVRNLADRGFVEAPSANPKRISALEALFQAAGPSEAPRPEGVE